MNCRISFIFNICQIEQKKKKKQKCKLEFVNGSLPSPNSFFLCLTVEAPTFATVKTSHKGKVLRSITD
ncbi:hypothetical protein BRARA_E02123 [Brassica rapa]|uniref:Uncharacterized protein n=1 Tax=Brassica campestris TaxID=3711 RepID=A0A397ZBT9_BRACM|nr:hypothetical protein BRARA_E02123 [Brassica rapa]